MSEILNPTKFVIEPYNFTIFLIKSTLKKQNLCIDSVFNIDI